MKKLLMIAAFLCGIQNAGAAFIDSGTYLTDTTSGLDWLDVTASAGRSYNDVSGQFGIGGDFVGWRYATGLEFNGLIGHWTGVVPSGSGFTLWSDDITDGLVAALGSTMDVHWLNVYGMTFDAYHGYPEGTFDVTAGLISDVELVTGSRWLAFIVDNDIQYPKNDVSNPYATYMKDFEIDDGFGSFLVRTSTVPEPSSIALLGLGLAGLCFSRRKTRGDCHGQI